MRCGGWVAYGLVGCVFLVATGGCVSIDDHRRLQAAHRNLKAQKEALDQELFDSRTAGDSLRTRVNAFQGELSTKNELVANLRGENALLDEWRKTAQGQLEDMAGRQRLGDISITGPKLPEQLHKALKRFADQHPTAVVYDSPRGAVRWKADLLFALGSDVVKESSMEAIRGFAEVLKSSAADNFEVVVVGHTDNRPIVRPSTKAKHPTNWHLSAHRAISVARALKKSGYPYERVGVMGYGEFRPTAENGTEGGAAQNRRVEILIVARGTMVHGAAG